MDNQNEAPQQAPLTEVEQLKLLNIRLARELERTRIRAGQLAIAELDRQETTLGDEINARLRAENAAPPEDPVAAAQAVRTRVLDARRAAMAEHGIPVDTLTESAVLDGQVVSRETAALAA